MRRVNKTVQPRLWRFASFKINETISRHAFAGKLPIKSFWKILKKPLFQKGF